MLFLAEVHWRLDQKELARRWYTKAVEWMDKNKPEAEKLRQYRTDGWGFPRSRHQERRSPGTKR